LSIDDVGITVLDRRGAYGGKVGPGPRFRHGECGDAVTRDASRKPPLLLLVVPVGEEIGHDDVRVEGKEKSAAVRPCEFLCQDERVEKIRSGAAVLLGQPGAEETL